MIWKSNLTPQQIAENAEKVRDLYLKEGLGDEEISKRLNLYPQAAYQLRKLLGLARKYGDIEREVRRINFNADTFSYKLGGFDIASLADRLGLDDKKSYGWRVSKVEKGAFTIEVTEIKAHKIGKMGVGE